MGKNKEKIGGTGEIGESEFGNALDAQIVRNHKDTVFRKLFSTKEKAIELYNALEGTNYGPDTEIEFTTLDNAIYVDKKNDLGFIIAEKHIVISEHQSTISFNIPLRDVTYIGRTFENITKDKNKYGRKGIMIPAPEFYVIYTGTEEWDEDEIRLSDYYLTRPAENSLELVVKIIKVGYNEGEKNSNSILERSPTLKGYSMFLKYINCYRTDGFELSEAISKAIKRCIDEDYIADFLRKEGKEVATMIFDEITQEEFAEIRANEAAEEAFKRGEAQGLKKGEAQGLKKGEAQGLKKGEAQGLRKGEAQGLKKGEAQKTFEIARMMKANQEPIERIIQYTGLSKEEIERL